MAISGKKYFHMVVRQHMQRVVEVFIITLLEISYRIIENHGIHANRDSMILFRPRYDTIPSAILTYAERL